MIELLEPRVLSAASNATANAPAGSPGPDLKVASIGRILGPVIAGAASRVALAVRNGAAATGVAPPSLVGMYVSADGVLNAGDRLIASAPVTRSLKPGGTFRTRVDIQFPSDLAAGTYHVLARVDDANAVAEGDETNNVADAGAVEVVAPFVDLVPVKVTRVRLWSWRGIGLTGAVTVLVRNEGNAAINGDVTGTWRVQGFSLTAQPYDDWTTPFAQTVSIEPGATAKITIPVESPSPHPEYVFTLTPRAPIDPTPDQTVWARAKVVYFSWGGRALNRGGIVDQGIGA